ncbi:hypothetical protein HDE_00637 [Halotydeus destructor]|nr:hypothetical protein HDE_00637 [Halotydeus destructor]
MLHFKLQNVILYIVFFTFTACSADNIIVKWSRLDSFLSDAIFPYAKYVQGQKIFGKDDSCSDAISKLDYGSLIRYLDSSSKPGHGILGHELGHYGHYDSCHASYCTIKFHFPLDSDGQSRDHFKHGQWHKKLWDMRSFFAYETPFYGVCVPRECSRDQLINRIQLMIANHKLPIKIDADCHDELNSQLDQTFSTRRIMQSLVIVMTGLVVMATLRGRLVRNNLQDALSYFDAIKNTRELFRVSRPSSSDEVKFLNGIRFIFFAMSIIGHVYVTCSGNAPSAHSKVMLDSNFDHWSVRHFFLKYSASTGMVVNVLLSGFFCYYSWHDVIKARKQVDLISYSLIRFIRPLPVLFFTIVLVMAFPVSWGSGPNYQLAISNITSNCMKNAWLEFAGISDLYRPSLLCIHHGWFMSADIKCYLVSYVIIASLPLDMGKGLRVALGVLAFGVIANVLVLWNYSKFKFIDMATLEWQQLVEDFPIVHFSAINYLAIYVLGILLGYAIKTNCDTQYRFQLWLACVTSLTVSLALPMAEGYLQSPFWKSTLMPITRLTFATAFAIFLFSLRQGQLTVLRTLLSSRFFELTSRMSYSTFMVHYLFVWYDSFTTRGTFDYVKQKNVLFVDKLIQVLIVSHFMGFFFFLLFESPTTLMMRKLIKKR